MSGMRLTKRVLAPERMDTEAVEHDDLARAHADLDRLAALGLAHWPMLRWLDRIARGRTALSVLDVGCGAGGMLRRIARWGERRGVALRLEGVDINPDVRRIAGAATPAGLPIRYHTGDALALGGQFAPDVALSTHFAHHLADDELAAFLRWMEGTARVGWFVNDLHRHWLPLCVLSAAPRLLGHHRFVVSDAPISVRRSFVRTDWEAVLAASGIACERVEIRWHFPFRWGVGSRPGS